MKNRISKFRSGITIKFVFRNIKGVPLYMINRIDFFSEDEKGMYEKRIRAVQKNKKS